MRIHNLEKLYQTGNEQMGKSAIDHENATPSPVFDGDDAIVPDTTPKNTPESSNAQGLTAAPVGPMLARLWRDWLHPYRGFLLLNLVLIAAVAGLTALYPIVIRWALDGFETRSANILAWAPLVVVVVVTLKSAALLGHKMLTNKVVTSMEAALQKAMYATLVRADLADLAQEAPAAAASRFSVDIGYLRAMVEKLVTALLRDGLTVIGLMVSLLWIDWQLTLYTLLVLPIAGWPISVIGRRLRKIARRSQQAAGEMTAHVNEGLSGIEVARAYKLEDYLGKRAGRSFEQLRDLKLRAANQKARIDPVLECLAGVGLALVFYVIGQRIAAGTNTIGDFMAFVSAFLIAGQPLRAFGNLYAETLQGSAAAERIFALLDRQPKITDKPEAEHLGLDAPVQGALQFENVSFGYEGGAEKPNGEKQLPASLALDHVSLDIPAGAKVALVGRSGSGKSTLMQLVPRLFDPQQGRVLIDGHDLRGISLSSLRDQIAIVSQDAMLFDDTIAANIRLGRADATDEEVRQAAMDAHADGFIKALAGGYNAQAGNGGQRFSGGERQRLSIARALLKDAPILLLDEVTSALDAQTEAHIRDALARLSAGRTTLVIAHRLSTVRDADMIVAMDEGRIVETGTHEQLLAKGGLYARLHALQFNS